METNDRKKRLDEAVRYLISIGLIDGKFPTKSITDTMGRNPQNVSSAIGSGNPRFLTRKFVRDFCSTYKNIISEDYIWDGEGEMLGETVVIEDAPIEGVPYYDVDFLGGFNEMENDQTKVPAYFINFQPYNKKGNVWCNIFGDSMSPRINSGDKICIQSVNNIEDIIYGEIYAIVTKSDLRTVKWVTRSPEEGMIRLIPENKDPRYGDYQDIAKIDIRYVYRVVGVIHSF